ncbi:MAG: hypothetical protein ABI439_07835 [Rhodospirillales bacterium]
MESFTRQNPRLDIYDGNILRGIFSRRIQQRRAVYEQFARISEAEEIRAKANDIAAWQDDPVALAEGISQYVLGIIGQNLIVVMDNVDRLDLDNQLKAFHLSLWFMERSKAFVILQMRDETYERYKNLPPLDTFRSGIAFHISPPRFTDVVKRRLELAVEYLAERAQERQEYVLESGARVVFPKSDLGEFLRILYTVIFGKRTNIARVLEALAGRDVRRALEMFVSIVTSGHLSTTAITSVVKGGGATPIAEFQIIKILMRGDYLHFSDNTTYMTNIFAYENHWKRPDNFLLSEVLFFLSLNRKRTGEIGLEGYFSVERICTEIERLGYDPNDVLQAINYLLKRQLILSDRLNFSVVGLDDCIKIQASGFIHLRVLCQRIEYLAGLIPVIPIADQQVTHRLADYVNREKTSGVNARDKAIVVETLIKFFRSEHRRLHSGNPFFDPDKSGALYVIGNIDAALRTYYKMDQAIRGTQDLLDF